MTLICTYSAFVFMHEIVHQEIFQHYGVDSHIEMDWLTFHGMTVPTDFNNISADKKQTMIYQQMNAEIVGYNAMILATAMIGSAFIIFIGLMLRERHY